MSRQKTLLKANLEANIDFQLLKYLKKVHEHIKDDIEEDHTLWDFLIGQIIRAGLPNNLYDEYGNPYIPVFELYELPIKRAEALRKRQKYEEKLEKKFRRNRYMEVFTDEENKEDT